LSYKKLANSLRNVSFRKWMILKNCLLKLMYLNYQSRRHSRWANDHKEKEHAINNKIHEEMKIHWEKFDCWWWAINKLDKW
jgi:thermostable 8-oxoguanine DNA glycosylase